MANKKTQKMLKLVCACGKCKHWEVLVAESTEGETRNFNHSDPQLVCATCGKVFPMTFDIGHFAGLHWEKQGVKEK